MENQVEMTDEELIGYMHLHSRTPRALFHKDHINRLLVLAGEDPDEVYEWQAWHYEDIKPTLDKARTYLQSLGSSSERRSPK